MGLRKDFGVRLVERVEPRDALFGGWSRRLQEMATCEENEAARGKGATQAEREPKGDAIINAKQ